MGKLPSGIKLSQHARERLEERKELDMKYNTQNIMRSSVKWYGKDDLINDCALYRHCCYTTRKSNQIGFITDGDIEVIYNKGSHVAITVLEVKDKFKPITQYIKPNIIEKIERKKVSKRLKDPLYLEYTPEYNIVYREKAPSSPLTINELYNISKEKENMLKIV